MNMDTKEESSMKKKCMKLLSMFMAVIMFALAVPYEANAAEPKIQLDEDCVNMKIISGSTVVLEFMIDREYDYEFYDVNVYKGSSTEEKDWVGYGTGLVQENSDQVVVKLTFNSSDWKLAAGTVCTVEYGLFYSDWNCGKNYEDWADYGYFTGYKTSTFEIIENVCNDQHNYGSSKVRKAATCTHEGMSVYTCKKCGVKKKEAIPKLSHKYGAGVVMKAPTCVEKGVKCYTCTSCGYTKTKSVAKISHKYDKGVVTKAPDCTSEGIKTYTCLSGCKRNRIRTIPKIGHKYDKGVVTRETTSSREGVRTYTCSNCNGTKTKAIAKKPDV